MRFALPILALTLLLPAAARAEIVEADPGDDIEALMNALAPGDELVLHGGDYPQSGRTGITMVGTEAMPIVVRAADGEHPVVFRDGADQNLIDFDRVEHATIRGIEFRGGSAGLRISAARFFTIEDCEIHDTADVALRANDGGAEYEALRILRNHIHDTHGTGEGMYLGCNEDGCRVFDSLIEGNWVHHTNADDVEQGDGIELKEGSFNNVIRGNVIHDTNYPCILTYSVVGNGGPNVIEGNAMWGCGDMGIQSAADATIRNNIILSAGANGIGCQPHQSGTPSNLIIVNNTVLDADGSALRVSGATGQLIIANNALFTDGATALNLGGDLSMLTLMGNVVAGAVSGGPGSGTNDATLAAFVGASFSGGVPNDVFPVVGGALDGTGAITFIPEVDFNGTARTEADVGAYVVAATNPGWTLAEGFHESGGPIPGTDAGVGTDGGVPGGDAGPTPDGSVPRDGGGTSGADAGPGTGGGGCACRASTGGSPVLGSLTLLVLGLFAARRRNDRARPHR